MIAVRINKIKLLTSFFIAATFTSSIAVNSNQSAIAEFLWTDALYYENCNQYAQLEKWDLAIENCNKAIKLDPKSAESYLVRGMIYDRQEKSALALADYNRAIELNPKLTSAYVNRTNIYIEQNKLQLARIDSETAIQLEPNFAQAHTTAGKLNLKLKNIEAARSNFQEAKQLFSARGETEKAEKMDEILDNLKYLKRYQNILSRLGYSGIFDWIIDFAMRE